jgi:hypothetical protein
MAQRLTVTAIPYHAVHSNNHHIQNHAALQIVASSAVMQQLVLLVSRAYLTDAFPSLLSEG